MKTQYKLPGNRVLTIDNDTDAASPRDMGDYLGTMVCLTRRYTLGDNDKHGYRFTDYIGRGLGALLADIKRDHKPLAILPLYLLDHSGLSISTGDFGDAWDSGMIGFIYVTRKDKENLWGKKRLTKKRMYEILKSEVAEYDAYLRGHTYGFTIEKIETCNLGHEHRAHEDSCWGFIGEDHEASGLLHNLSDADADAVRAQIRGEVAA
jgi:hypothetical protein